MQRLNTNTSQIQRNILIYSSKNRLVAEIDLLIERPNTIDIYEVKCSFRMIKARKQLHKIKKLLAPTHQKPIKLYFYHGGGDELITIT